MPIRLPVCKGFTVECAARLTIYLLFIIYEGESNTRYFFNLENRCQFKKNITKLKINDNTFIYDQYEILDKQKQFYESIYQSKENDNNNSQESIFFKAEKITPLSLDDQKLCDGFITEAECINAINGFKKDKTPGTDGFSAEFYKFFWPELRTEMLSSFHFAFQTGSLSISQRRGVIALIPKKDKDKSLLENLRPISLLNVDYKIFIKVIAKRIEKVLPKIINPNQTGYVKGRFIGENTRLIQDVMFLTKNANTPGIATFLDFRKAFDTIKWNYVLSAIRLFNFGPDIQKWIEVIYHNVSSCVLNNGHASPFFQLHRGVRQGCPLSGLLFVIGIELLAGALQNDNSIKGVSIGKKEIKFSQFADDTTVFVRDQASVSNLIKTRQRGRVVSVSDSQSGGPGFESRSGHFLDLFLGTPEFKSSATLVNSQLICLLPVGILNNVIFNLSCLFKLFARPH